MAKPVKKDGAWTHTHHYDQKGNVYITDDGHWLWDPNLRRESGECGDWYPNPLKPEPCGLGGLFGNQQQERTEVSMYIWNIVAIKFASVVETQQGKSTEVLVPPQAIMAKEQNTAVAIFGARNAEVLDKVSADLLQIQVRQGV